MNKDEVQSFFDSEAGEYTTDVLEGSVGNRFLNHLDIELFENAIEDLAFKRVLDVGIGNGRFSSRLWQRSEEIVGVDLSEAMLEMSRQRLASADNIKFVAGDIERIDLDQLGTFDLIVSFRVFKYFENISDTVTRLAEQVRPGGVMVIGFANSLSYQGALRSIVLSLPFSDKLHAYMNSLSLISSADAEAAFQQAGLNIRWVEANILFPYFLYSRLPMFLNKPLYALDRFLQKIGGKRFARDFVICAERPGTDTPEGHKTA